MWTVIRLQLSVNNRIVTCQKSHASQLLEKLLWFWLYDTTSNSALSEVGTGEGGVSHRLLCCYDNLHAPPLQKKKQNKTKKYSILVES